MRQELVDQRNLERLPKRWDIEEVCNRIAAGESLAQIAQSYAKSKQALWKYLNTDESRRKRYLESLEARGILHLEAIERIARDVETGELDARAGAVAFQCAGVILCLEAHMVRLHADSVAWPGHLRHPVSWAAHVRHLRQSTLHDRRT